MKFESIVEIPGVIREENLSRMKMGLTIFQICHIRRIKITEEPHVRPRKKVTKAHSFSNPPDIPPIVKISRQPEMKLTHSETKAGKAIIMCNYQNFNDKKMF